MSKEKFLQNHPGRQETEFLNSLFQFPEVYNMVDVTSVFQTGPEVERLQETSLDSNRVEDMDPHPFCKQLGLNLWSTDVRPAGQKMDLAALTNGAVIEIFMFVRELCSSPHRIVYDILEHNFDLDLQSGETMAAQVIQRWYSTQKRMSITSKSLVTWKNDLVPLNGHAEQEPEPEPEPEPKPKSEPEPEPPIFNHQEVLDSEDVKPKKEDLNGGFEKKVLGYRICEEIGLDLNIRSQQGPKTKLDVHFLTRGVLFEMHQYVRQNCNRYVPALYEILEYNFDLSSQNHRKVEFAWSIASQVIAIAGKHGRKGDYLNKVIELPVEITESSQSVCKEEPKEELIEVDLNNDNDIVFVRELMPVDIDVMID
ncbi:Cell surface antigen I/II [Dissostichus eleginoides]|uniref:Cell surface antigen I/II n=1 Tax=Dissostichus eleginoides TaxID=100907 RepID=A0AAD9F298_DISEL|nr:Cell surface antigen I/II [Dissostichus eleginoides]